MYYVVNYHTMNTPKNFALQLGALVTMYVSIGSLIALLCGVITILFPDAAENYYAASSTSGTIRLSVATLIVVFPVYLVLTRTVNHIRRNEEVTYHSLTKWLIYLSLLVGGAILVGDLITVLYGYLSGELTIRFALKALVLAVIILAAFYYYLKDAQGYWQSHEKLSIRFGFGAILLVVGALALGFVYSETPQEVREAKIDDNQIMDLQDMQWRIEEYYRINNKLPETIEEVYKDFSIPDAPDGRTPYKYKVTTETAYELCATFAQNTSDTEYVRPVPVYDKNYTWVHGEGEWCFNRVIERANVTE